MTKRLETIKELVKKIESIIYDEWRQQELTNLIESLYYDDHVDWLINRIEELELEVERQKNRKYLKMRQRDDFMKKAQRYKQALEFYAERDNYQWEVSYRPQQEIDCMVIDDSGHTARKALKGETK